MFFMYRRNRKIDICYKIFFFQCNLWINVYTAFNRGFDFITYRSEIKRFDWSIALFNIFRRIARSKNWTKMHENRHVIKGIQHSGAEQSSVLHSAWSNLVNSPFWFVHQVWQASCNTLLRSAPSCSIPIMVRKKRTGLDAYVFAPFALFPLFHKIANWFKVLWKGR